MFTFLADCHKQTTKSFEVRKRVTTPALRLLLNKAPQGLKETPEDCVFFNATNFHRFYVQLFNIFSLQLDDQPDADSLIYTLQLQPF